ncbi:MAG: hypothetical protein ACP5JW_07730, partial [Candidatus Bathyarchaeia archaeon]
HLNSLKIPATSLPNLASKIRPYMPKVWTENPYGTIPIPGYTNFVGMPISTQHSPQPYYFIF